MNVYVCTPEKGQWMEIGWDSSVEEWKVQIRRKFEISYEFKLVMYNRLYQPNRTLIPDAIRICEFPLLNHAHVKVERS